LAKPPHTGTGWSSGTRQSLVLFPVHTHTHTDSLRHVDCSVSENSGFLRCVAV
jgi:hypothetical protein